MQQSASVESDRETIETTAPRHVAIIMDGNGRWAINQGRSRTDGHRAGTDNLRRIIESFACAGVEYLTLFAFSTENWDRPDSEVNALITILQESISRDVNRLHGQGVRIRHLGELNRLNPDIRMAIQDSINLTRSNTRLTLSVAFNYGGRAEIVDAVRRIIIDEEAAEEISDQLFSEYLYTCDIPDPDLIIRTAGEMRISNFLLWQSAYAEYYTTKVLWPDFNENEVDRALEVYSQRVRRFGRVHQADRNQIDLL